LLVWTGGGWRLIGRLVLVPGVIRVARVAYRWIARNRHRMPGGSAACAVPPRDTDSAA
jgi:predicted DCC family thiol-disulfide oxidoreductase YuxK